MNLFIITMLFVLFVLVLIFAKVMIIDKFDKSKCLPTIEYDNFYNILKQYQDKGESKISEKVIQKHKQMLNEIATCQSADLRPTLEDYDEKIKNYVDDKKFYHVNDDIKTYKFICDSGYKLNNNQKKVYRRDMKENAKCVMTKQNEEIVTGLIKFDDTSKDIVYQTSEGCMNADC